MGRTLPQLPGSLQLAYLTAEATPYIVRSVARHKDMDWNLPEGVRDQRGARTHSWESINVSVLMDIRDELKEINQVLRCSSTQAIPGLLAKIATNTKIRKRKK